MLRIITINLNGIRSAHAKEFAPWLRKRVAAICKASRFPDHAPVNMDGDCDAAAA